MSRLSVIVAVLLLAACGGSPSRLKLDPPAALREFTPQLRVEVRWARQLGQGVGKHMIALPPLVERDRLYAANRKGRVESFERESGTRVWRTELEAAINSGPGDGGDVLLFGGDAEVIAVDKRDGTLHWRAPVSSEVLAAPQRSGNVVVVRSVDGALFGLDASDGRRLWRYRQPVPLLSLRGVGEPQIEGAIVVAGFDNGRLAAVSLQDGRPLWELVLAVPRGRTELERLVDVDARLMVRDGVVYAAGYQGRIAAVTLDSGRLLWTRDFSTWSGLTVAGREIYVTDAEGNVWALARSNGGTLWKQTALRGRTLSAPAVQGGAVVVADFEGYVHWLAREEGSLLARMRVEDREALYPVPSYWPHNGYREDRAVLAAPQVLDDHVYAMDKRGTLNALRVLPD
ncbi:MAG: outer membrane protein assembly factor BamB [Thiohalomonadaceae bacterium]